MPTDRTITRLPSLALPLALASACSVTGTIADDDEDVLLSTDLRLLENHPNCEEVVVAPDRLSYRWRTDARNVDVGVGSILVGAEGGGYVRRVTSVAADGHELAVTTEPASLADAVLAGDLELPLLDGSEACRDGGCLEFDLIDLSDTVLFDGDVGGVPLSVVIPQGGLRFSPAVDFDMSIGFPGRIERLSGLVTGTFVADLQLQVRAGGSIEFAHEVDVSGPAAPLYTYPFTFVAPTPLGPLPIVGTVELDVFVGFRAQASAIATARTGVTATAELAVGATYDDGEWTATAEPSFEASFDPIALDARATTTVEAYARPEVSVIFYGVAGPNVAVEPLVRLRGEIDPPDPLHTTLEACLRSELGFSVQIFSFSLADFSRSLEGCTTLFESN